MKTGTDPVGSVSRRRKNHAADLQGPTRAHAAATVHGRSSPRSRFVQRLDALGVFFVGRVQRIQLFFIDDVEKSFAHHGQLEAQAAFTLAFLWYFGNDPVQAGWNLRADQWAVGVEQSDGWIQRTVALVAFLRGRAEATPPISVADGSSSEDSA